MEAKRAVALVLLVTCLQVFHGAPVDDKEKNFALKFLKGYHYLSPLKNGNHNFKDALRLFQQNSEIPDTGDLNEATIKEMHKPRCGVPDLDEEENSESGRIKRFSVSGDKWNEMQLTYSFHNYASNGNLTSTQQRQIVRRAFTQWEEVGPLTFVDVTDNSSLSSSADIKLSFFSGAHSPCSFSFDGENGVLAHAFFPRDGAAHFDDDETFTDGVATGKNLYSVALHEIGHLLGLRHSRQTYAIMHQTYKTFDPNMNLTSEERHGIQYIYDGGTVQPDDATAQPTLTVGTCADKLSECHDYRDWCNDANHGTAMRANCPKACGLCGNVTSCSDAFHVSSCTFYKQHNYCDHPEIKSKCQKTCFNCTTG